MFRFLAVLLLASSAWAQSPTPNCQYRFRFTNRAGEPTDGKVVYSGATPTIALDNSSQGCVGWQVLYSAEGFSAVSLTLQTSTKEASGAGGTWSTFSGTDVLSTLPLTSTARGNYIGYAYYPYIRVNLTTATGTGSVDVLLRGWVSQTYLAGASGGGGGSATSSVRLQTNTTDTILTTDQGDLVSNSNAAAIAVTLPTCGSAGFAAGWFYDTQNRGAGTVTITPTTSTIDGVASLDLLTGQGVRIVCGADNNYYTERGTGLMSGSGLVAGEFIMYELAANGSNYYSFRSPDSRTTSLVELQPTADPSSGQSKSYSAPSSGISTVTWITPATTSQLPLSGTTSSIGGGALAAGACASGTVSVTSSTTSMTVAVSPNTYPGDGVLFYGYVSANGTVTVKVCAVVAVTPTASTYNVRVIQ